MWEGHPFLAPSMPCDPFGGGGEGVGGGETAPYFLFEGRNVICATCGRGIPFLHLLCHVIRFGGGGEGVGGGAAAPYFLFEGRKVSAFVLHPFLAPSMGYDPSPP